MRAERHAPASRGLIAIYLRLHGGIGLPVRSTSQARQQDAPDVTDPSQRIYSDWLRHDSAPVLSSLTGFNSRRCNISGASGIVERYQIEPSVTNNSAFPDPKRMKVEPSPSTGPGQARQRLTGPESAKGPGGGGGGACASRIMRARFCKPERRLPCSPLRRSCGKRTLATSDSTAQVCSALHRRSILTYTRRRLH